MFFSCKDGISPQFLLCHLVVTPYTHYFRKHPYNWVYSSSFFIPNKSPKQQPDLCPFFMAQLVKRFDGTHSLPSSKNSMLFWTHRTLQRHHHQPRRSNENKISPGIQISPHEKHPWEDTNFGHFDKPNKLEMFRKIGFDLQGSIFPGKKHTKNPKVPCISFDLGVSKNRGAPKWMVYNGKPY